MEFSCVCVCVCVCVQQAVAFGLFSMPLMLFWEKLWGLHYSHYLVRTACRIPVALTLWLLALAFPFFGPLNSMIGALFMSFSVFIIPCIAYIITFWSPQARQVTTPLLRSSHTELVWYVYI
jgi:auxin influx carrier (AUX1 LAX family)